MSKNYIVVGAGFRGFCDALALLNIPGNTVHIVDSVPFFGGIAYSRAVKGFWVDNGVHVFDSVTQDLADIVNEIMEGQTRSIEFVSASAFNSVVTDGFSLPDLASLDEATKSKITMELLALAAHESTEAKAKSLQELFYARYGKTAGGIFSDIFEKVYSISPAEIEKSGMSVTSLHRLKHLDDDEMRVLKSHPWLDTVLAARRKAMGKIDDLVSLYPDTGESMKGWCDRAVTWLEKKGARISLGEKILSIETSKTGVTVKTDKQEISGHQVIWSNDNIDALARAVDFEFEALKYQHRTPMLFATMMTDAKDIKNFTYLQNFEPDGLTYRTAAAGIFSNQIREDGVSFITSECPCAIGSEAWNVAEAQMPKIWDECKRLGIVSQDAVLRDHDILRIPGTFKPPKIGFTEKVEEFCAELPKKSDRVFLRNVTPFFRRDIYLDSLKLPEMVS